MEPSNELRYEMKLVCAAHRLGQARMWLRLHPEGFRIAYPPRWVNNLYFDTPHLNSFSANLDGVSARQKLRLRWYGSMQRHITNPNLELKTKENLLGDKQRQKLACTLDWQRPYSHLLQTIQSAAGPEWQRWLRAALQPVLINRYRRAYFVSPDGALRATLDDRQAAFDQRLSQRPNLQRPLPLPNVLIIELKAPADQVARLQAAMAHFPLPRSRSSKYATGVLAALA